MAQPRWKQIADSIGADIREGRLRVGAILPSETELAAQFRVCRVTAHRAMQELQRQGVVTRRRKAGTQVVEPPRQRTGQVAVLLNSRDTLEQAYLSGIRAGLTEEYDLLLCDIRCDAQREAHYLRRMRDEAAGIVCLPTCDPHNTRLLNGIARAGVPIVCLDCIPEGAETDAIVSDNYGAVREALRHLTARGHRRIAFFTEGREPASSLQEREEAYRQVMAEVGVDDPRRWMRAFPRVLSLNPALLRQPAYDSLFTLLHQPEPPTALFCAHDYLLFAAIQACRDLEELGANTLEIVSFNDCPPVVPYLPGTVHRIVQRAEAMGRIAAERLHRRLYGESPPPETLRVRPQFLPAESLAR